MKTAFVHVADARCHRKISAARRKQVKGLTESVLLPRGALSGRATTHVLSRSVHLLMLCLCFGTGAVVGGRIDNDTSNGDAVLACRYRCKSGYRDVV